MQNNCNIQYYPKVKKVKINKNSTEFYPQYLKYLFEYLKIPQNATLIFKDKTIPGGIVEWLKQENQN
jgi:hypothetical protein